MALVVTKRKRNGSVERAGDPMVTIGVRDQTGDETMFKIKRSTIFWKIMTCYALRKGVEATSLAFFLDIVEYYRKVRKVCT